MDQEDRDRQDRIIELLEKILGELRDIYHRMPSGENW